MYGRWRNTKVSLKVGLCRWLPHDLGVVVDVGEVLPLFRCPVWRCVVRHASISETSWNRCQTWPEADVNTEVDFRVNCAANRRAVQILLASPVRVRQVDGE